MRGNFGVLQIKKIAKRVFRKYVQCLKVLPYLSRYRELEVNRRAIVVFYQQCEKAGTSWVLYFTSSKSPLSPLVQHSVLTNCIVWSFENRISKDSVEEGVARTGKIPRKRWIKILNITSQISKTVLCRYPWESSKKKLKNDDILTS